MVLWICSQENSTRTTRDKRRTKRRVVGAEKKVQPGVEEEERRFSFLGLFSGFSPAFLILFLYFSYTFLILFLGFKREEKTRKGKEKTRKGKEKRRKAGEKARKVEAP